MFALLLSLAAMTGMVNNMNPDIARMRAAAGEGYSTATDLADWLVRAIDMPFREAHRITGRIVAKAEVQKVPLHDLSLAAMQAIEQQSRRTFSACCPSKARFGAAGASAARRRPMCAGSLSDGSRRWRGNGPDGLAMLSPPQCDLVTWQKQEVWELSSSPNTWTVIWTARSPVLLAVLIAVAAGTGLAGCGRKGGLDPPPLAAPPAPPPTDQQGMLVQPGSIPQYALPEQPVSVFPSRPRRA